MNDIRLKVQVACEKHGPAVSTTGFGHELIADQSADAAAGLRSAGKRTAVSQRDAFEALRLRTPRRKCKVRLYAGFCAAGCPAVAIIRLGAHLRARSSHLPAASPSRVEGCLFGVAARRDCPFHPARRRNARPTRLCCSDPHLTVDRCYLLRRSVQSGRSSRGAGPPAIARRTLPDRM
jgi:hypothetical protein